MLSEVEKYRYDRQIKLDGIGIEGQLKLKNAAVLVVGAGGLGCPALQYLAAAGVGHIGIIDFDVVDESNLQRQVLFNTDDLGSNKAEAAKQHLEKLNPLVQLESYTEKLSAKNALDTLKPFDIILDCSDNFATRYLVNDATVILEKALVYGAIYKYEGQVTVFNHHQGPSYRCLFPTPPKQGTLNCAELGVLGVLPGIIGTHQATEALKLILGIGTPLSGKMLLYNALNAEYTHIQIPRNDEIIQAVKNDEGRFHDRDYDEYCEREAEAMREINLDEFYEHLNNGSMKILDVREPWETPKIEGAMVLNIPVGRIEESVELIPKTVDLIVACQHGIRSKAVVQHLQTNYNFENLINLKGGLTPYE